MAEDEEFDHWDVKFAEIDKKVGQLVRKTAFDAERIAKSESRVDKGTMRAGWYTRTENDSGYGGATAAAKGRAVHSFRLGKNAARNAAKFARRNAEESAFAGITFPEVPPTPHNEAWIINAIIYTIWHELGTAHMTAKPMAAPAINRVKKPFLDALERLANGGS